MIDTGIFDDVIVMRRGHPLGCSDGERHHSELTSMSENNAVGDVLNVAEKKTIVEKVTSLLGGTYSFLAVVTLIAALVFFTGPSVSEGGLDDELIVAGNELGYNWTSDSITTFEKRVKVDNNFVASDVIMKMYELQCSSGFVEACDYMSVREAVQDASSEEHFASVKPFYGLFIVALTAFCLMVFWAENIRYDARYQRLKVHSPQEGK